MFTFNNEIFRTSSALWFSKPRLIMTKRDFFIVLIKVFGLSSVITTIFSVLPGNIYFALLEIDNIAILWIAVTIIIVIGLFLLLIFRSGKIVSLLKLDKGFDNDKIEIGNLQQQDIIKIGVFIIGGFLILENTPGFLSHTYFALKWDVAGVEYTTQEKFDWGLSGLNLIIGFLLLTNYEWVARLFKTKLD